jgi:hypothetical protein
MAVGRKCVKTSPQTLVTKELAVVPWQRTVSHFLFHQGIFTKTNMTVIPHPSYFPLFLRLKIKLKGLHFDTTEVIKTESQVVLNTLIEHDFQDAFKKWQKRWEWCIHTGGDYFKSAGGQ